MKFGLIALVVVAFAFATVSPQAKPQYILTAHGIGPLKIGMTLQQVEAAIHRKIVVNDEASGDPTVCGEVEIPGWKGIGALFEYNRITVIYIGKPYRTLDGVYVGMSEANLKRRYGNRAVFDYRPYFSRDPHAHNVVVKESGKREFLFQTENNKISTISVGDLPGVEYWEGCA